MYRIGELAHLANVSKRTIDYYTNLGLLKAHRSKSNYRIYTEKAIDDLKFIEECKKLHFPLDEIKRKLEMKQMCHVKEEELNLHVQSVIKQMKQLRKDLQMLIPVFSKLDRDKQCKILNAESSLLIDSLMKIKD